MKILDRLWDWFQRRGRFPPAIVLASRLPLWELACSISRFDDPFQFLKDVDVVFDPQARIVLDHCIGGDEEALVAREARIRAEHDWLHNMTGQAPATIHAQYVQAHGIEIETISRRRFPFLSPRLENLEDFAPEPRIDDILDSLVFHNLGAFGFSRATRRKGVEFWRCTSRDLDYPVELEFDKGTYSRKLTARLNIEKAYHFADLGYPFFFSNLSFPFSVTTNIEDVLNTFFEHYARVFPHVWRALDRGISNARAAA